MKNLSNNKILIVVKTIQEVQAIKKVCHRLKKSQKKKNLKKLIKKMIKKKMIKKIRLINPCQQIYKEEFYQKYQLNHLINRLQMQKKNQKQLQIKMSRVIHRHIRYPKTIKKSSCNWSYKFNNNSPPCKSFSTMNSRESNISQS